MLREISTGAQDFKSMRDNGDFYVDKTSFISKWWKGRDIVSLITRPRRFGKTLNMSMLNCFFSNEYAGQGRMFEGLKVWDDPSMRAEQGQWPVIPLSFANIKQTNWEEARQVLNEKLTEARNAFRKIMDDPMFTDEDRKNFYAINREMNDATASTSLYNLCGWVKQYYGKKVIVLLDEYDTPMQEAWISGYWDEMVSYIRALFNSTFKTNPSLERGLMTGITRVSKESIFSDLNNLVVVTTTSNMYADCFGFTEEEVFRAMEERGFGTQDKQEVRKWYDGFTFGAITDMYNPWSITNYLKLRKTEIYWANTSSNGLVGHLLRTGRPAIKSFFEALLNGESIRVPVDEQIIFSQLNTEPAAVWSLLLASGYLKVVHTTSFREPDASQSQRIYTLALTNHEVFLMFDNLIRLWFAEADGLSCFSKAMLQGNVRDMSRYLNDIMLCCMSSFDGGKQASSKQPENFYHGLVLGLLAENRKDYLLKSNRESGYGRYDVMMEPKNPQGTAVILEFKVFDPIDDESKLEDTAANALKQIEDKKYDTVLLEREIPADRILKYGIAFRGKECLIRRG